MVNEFQVDLSVPSGGSPSLIAIPAPARGYFTRLVLVPVNGAAQASSGTLVIRTDQDVTTIGETGKLSPSMYYVLPELAFAGGTAFFGVTSMLAASPRVPYMIDPAYRVGDTETLVLAIQHDQGATATYQLSYCILEVESD